MKVRDILGVLLVLAASVGIIVCSVFSIIFYFKNPDMTSLRKLIEYPEPAIWAIICFICGKFGLYLIKTK